MKPFSDQILNNELFFDFLYAIFAKTRLKKFLSILSFRPKYHRLAPAN